MRRPTIVQIKVVHGASDGAVADIFRPKWFADRIFPICGGTFLVACVILAARLVVSVRG